MFRLIDQRFFGETRRSSYSIVEIYVCYEIVEDSLMHTQMTWRRDITRYIDFDESRRRHFPFVCVSGERAQLTSHFLLLSQTARYCKKWHNTSEDSLSEESLPPPSPPICERKKPF